MVYGASAMWKQHHQESMWKWGSWCWEHQQFNINYQTPVSSVFHECHCTYSIRTNDPEHITNATRLLQFGVSYTHFNLFYVLPLFESIPAIQEWECEWFLWIIHLWHAAQMGLSPLSKCAAWHRVAHAHLHQHETHNPTHSAICPICCFPGAECRIWLWALFGTAPQYSSTS